MVPAQKGSIATSVLILLLFAVVALLPLYSSGIANVKKNWAKYRCDPRVMPFAGVLGHDTMSNFVQCAQQIQSGVMDEMLVPVNYNIGSISGTMGELGSAVQDVRQVMNQTRHFLGSITSSIFGVFLNIALQFEFTAIKTRDMIAKLIGVVVTLMYMLTGGVKVGESINNGPIVGMMKAVCFDPNTLVPMSDGTTKAMRDITNGEKLAGGSIVTGTLLLSNVQREPLYEMASVRVTGDHKVRDAATGRYIAVRDHIGSRELAEEIHEVACLMTSDHLIRINGEVFWDWED
jgi:hypothetical protein